MTHPGQQLSALIDGELEASERMRVLSHVTKCGSCRDEVAALHTLKRRMKDAVSDAAAGAGLTGRLIGLSDLMPSGGSFFPPPPPPGAWHPSTGATSADRHNHPDQRAARFFLAGSVAIFLAGLGTAAVIAGGEPQARAPAPPVIPSVDVLVAPHNSAVNHGLNAPGTGVTRRVSRDQWSHPDVDLTYQPVQP